MTDLKTEHFVHLVNFDEGTGYTEEVTLDGGDLKNIEYVNEEPDWEGSNIFFKKGQSNRGRALKPFQMPKRLTWHHDEAKMPDFMRSNGHYWVNDKAKAAIEALEPNIHQFFELEGWALVAGKPSYVQSLYLFNACNLISAADREQTTIPPEKDGRLYNLARANGTRLEYVANLNQIDGHHFWIERNASRTSAAFFMSDQAKSAFEAADVTGLLFRSYPAVERDN